MNDRALSFDDISLVPRYSNIMSRKDVDTTVQLGNSTLSVPVLSANMDTITGAEMAARMNHLGGVGVLHRFCSVEDNVAMLQESWDMGVQMGGGSGSYGGSSICSLGVNEGLDRFHALYEIGARQFCIDIAHGHSKPVGALIQQLKEFDESVFVIAGNVCEQVGAGYLADKGADAIKVGIGPGSVCTTRLKTGFGVPQFTAIRQCRRVNCFIIADGGIRSPGDAVKAFYAGADAIMVGGMLAGTDETPGTIRQDYEAAPRYKVFRGMASKEAQDEFMGSMHDWKTAEGVETKVRYQGPLAHIIADIMGGIRSGMTYCGANTLSQIRSRADFVEVTAAGRVEGTPHGEGRL